RLAELGWSGPIEEACINIAWLYLVGAFDPAVLRPFMDEDGSPNTMSKKLSMLLSRYGFPGKTAHSLRHFCCTDIIRRTGGNISLAKMLMRHRDVRSTMRYDHPTLDDLRGAVNRRSE
ncbi:MAG: site-specific integrase, partial [Planctomycetes bacterium]|nr:site-specific integrase [Planctomycetota bacterium]